VTATEASRVAQNFSSLHSVALKKYGFDIQRISGEGEAYYTSLGVVKGIIGSRLDEVTVMDIGGASTELIKIQLNDFKILESISLPIGSVRATNWLSNNQLKLKISEVFGNNNLEAFRTDKLICVAGTMTTLAAMQEGMSTFDEDKIHGVSFSNDQLNTLVSHLSKKDSEAILCEFPFCGKRAFSIYGGAIVAQEFSKRLGTEEFEISTYGLRYGVAIEGRIDERYI
jgi:exopolyphosphatase/guanosine-5'-triphosphate,3'-diphosphate pyrophosphatase